ncbi:MAG: SGNH/GDSL hydrolase family protein [Planctomycetes bacterium]|nr:SGNH/GDSL hydrolase family protein [Planctomycetota bacterium]
MIPPSPVSGLGRAPLVLASIALCLLAGLMASRSCTVVADERVVRVAPQAELPPWKPGPNWATAPEPVRPSGRALQIPIYPAWTRKQAEELFVIGAYEIFDPLCGKLWKPNLTLNQGLPEYDGGKVTFVTNSLSMREDEEVREKRPTLRVLVTGDSHTDGVCHNSESFPNLAEKALRQRAHAEAVQRGESFDPQAIEVLNAGKGTFSFFNYLGLLERRLDLKPDVFVVTVYGGNDFEEVLWPWHDYGYDGPRPEGAGRYLEQIEAAKKVQKRCLSQALVSLKLFDTYPEQQEIAVRAGAAVMEKIQALCRERGIRLLVLYLPSRPDVEPLHPDLKLRKLLAALELETAALASTDRMADQLLAKLAGLGIETVDLRPVFLQSKESAYWNFDWHINLVGHRLAAGALVKALSMRQ